MFKRKNKGRVFIEKDDGTAEKILNGEIYETVSKIADIFDKLSSRKFNVRKMHDDLSDVCSSFNSTEVEHGNTFVTIEVPIEKKEEAEEIIQKWLDEGMRFYVEGSVNVKYVLTKI